MFIVTELSKSIPNSFNLSYFFAVECFFFISMRLFSKASTFYLNLSILSSREYSVITQVSTKSDMRMRLPMKRGVSYYKTASISSGKCLFNYQYLNYLTISVSNNSIWPKSTHYSVSYLYFFRTLKMCLILC